VLAAAAELEREGVEVVRVGVDADGRLDEAALARALETPVGLASLMAVNNETGVILDPRAVAGVLLHVDAVQAAGRLPLPDADLITLSGHKLGGLKGTGALIGREDLPLAATAVGGPQERGKRAGTENVAGAVALATALDLAEQERETEAARLAALRDRIDLCLASIEGARILGASAPRVANTTTAVFEGVDSEAVLQALDLEGIATSSGSACSSGSLEPSHVLLAMGIPEGLARSAVRFSLGWATTEDDVNALTSVLAALVERARSAAR
jgi:cysteine desulfurase